MGFCNRAEPVWPAFLVFERIRIPTIGVEKTLFCKGGLSKVVAGCTVHELMLANGSLLGLVLRADHQSIQSSAEKYR
jgi:hypothetical protein